MLTGQHPILQKGDDKVQYREKMKDFKGLKIPASVKIPDLARNLIESMCSLKPLARYRVEQALRHPWVTGNHQDEIPMTNDLVQTTAIKNFENETKLRRLFSYITFLSIAKQKSAE